MHHLLETLVKCDQHIKIKEKLINVCIIQAAANTHVEYLTQNIIDIFSISWKLAVSENDVAMQEICCKVFESWAVNKRPVLVCWMMSPDFLDLLTSFNIENINVHMKLASFCYTNNGNPENSSALVKHLANVLVTEADMDSFKVVGQLVSALGPGLFHLVPVLLIQSLLQRTLALLVLVLKQQEPQEPCLDEDNGVKEADALCSLFKCLWTLSNETIQITLENVYRILSKHQMAHILPLAAVVNEIQPSKYETLFCSLVVGKTDGKELMLVIDHMLSWLAWPNLTHTKSWIHILLKALLNSDKAPLVVQVFERKVDQIVNCLFKLDMMDAAFEILAFLLLSCQKTVIPFHRFANRVPSLVEHLKELRGDSFKNECLPVLGPLLLTLIHHHSGFPDIYDPILTILDAHNFKGPSVQEMETCLRVFQVQRSSISGHFDATSEMATNDDLYAANDAGLTGLVNNGNTCYVNSILSALFMTQSFRNQVLRSLPQPGEILIEKLQEVFAYLLLSERSFYNAKDFVNLSRPPWFESGTQQDCFEFLHYLLNRVQEEELRAAAPASPGGPSVSLTQVHHFFGGVTETTYVCHKCHNHSENRESFTELQLPLAEQIAQSINGECKFNDGVTRNFGNIGSGSPFHGSDHAGLANVSEINIQKVENSIGGLNEVPYNSNEAPRSPHCGDVATVTEKCDEGLVMQQTEQVRTPDVEMLLGKVFHPELLHDDNMYRCDRCQDLCNAERLFHISQPPDYLILTLLRFAYCPKQRSRRKLFQKVTLQKMIRVPVVNKQLGGTPELVNYCLYAVVMHSGGSAESGHYFTYARNSDAFISSDVRSSGSLDHLNDALEDKWFQFNDERVSASAFESFERLADRFTRDVPYVLFYTKVQRNGITVQILNAETNLINSRLKAMVELDNQLFLRERNQRLKIKSMKIHRDPDDDSSGMGGCGGGGIGGSNHQSARFVF